jgi:hypothetical protein
MGWFTVSFGTTVWGQCAKNYTILLFIFKERYADALTTESKLIPVKKIVRH